ncbi:MAG TPA: hypothetical protein DHV15_06085 [Treponema sp.]|uniref:Uncharacterized protein n=1 Tax=Treponema denticola (strain ATCC 35405 / DSM 14222 / CIP 103919 / JCM 8153 / KCTC 15104) TaxID=243275 RepID=Q73QI5_TREDE|nr:hypothetical protein TDE_0458 [Treponema denticola ATCC 35405]HCY95069.1 hypothetical protein [Treponema sp.]
MIKKKKSNLVFFHGKKSKKSETYFCSLYNFTLDSCNF